MDAETIAKGLTEAQRADLQRIEAMGVAASSWQLGIDLFALDELHQMKLIHKMPMRNGEPLWGMAKGGAEVREVLLRNA